MNKNYFRYVPNFEYVNRLGDSQIISDYLQVKNLFKRVKLTNEVFSDLTFFTKYKIVGDERPDNVAFKLYNDQNLDWIILLSNNIINYVEEWPLTQQGFENYMIGKYGENNFDNIHHYESLQVKDGYGRQIIPKGLEVSQDFSVTYYDGSLKQSVTKTNSSYPVTNLQYEDNIQTNKRNIYALKPKYISLVINDIENLMQYEPGSSQYVSETLVKGENIKLF